MNERELTELNSSLVGVGEEGILLLAKNPNFTPKMAVRKLLFCDSERMRNYAEEKSRNNRRIYAAKMTHFKVTFLDKQLDIQKKKKKECAASPL